MACRSTLLFSEAHLLKRLASPGFPRVHHVCAEGWANGAVLHPRNLRSIWTEWYDCWMLPTWKQDRVKRITWCTISLWIVRAASQPIAAAAFDWWMSTGRNNPSSFIVHSGDMEFSVSGGYNMLAMDLLGPSLDAVFQKCGRHFSSLALKSQGKHPLKKALKS